MEAMYGKIKDMLNAYYPVLYLTTFEYYRTKQKIETSAKPSFIEKFPFSCV